MSSKKKSCEPFNRLAAARKPAMGRKSRLLPLAATLATLAPSAGNQILQLNQAYKGVFVR